MMVMTLMILIVFPSYFLFFYLSIYRLKHHLLPCLISISIDSKLNSTILMETNKLHYIQKFLKFYILLSEKYKSLSASIKEYKNHGNSSSCSSSSSSGSSGSSSSSSASSKNDNQAIINDEIIQMAIFSQSLPVDLLPIAAISLL